ncbi:hypothetical protein [Prauserella alba]|uniref:Uncharacterized protein n=1 Tax=Prauserella alba TaxID=176898 RepID=A0ABN1VF71_9PSEU|nr:hypothetical protein [Prauserella alba]MCP2180033.1 hypothetical protein [Prauserella alba]
MFGFGKKKTPARNTSANRAAATKSGKAKPTTATRTKAKCTVCRQRRQVDTTNKICGRHQCAKALTQRLEATKPRAKKKTTSTKTKATSSKPTAKRATPAASSRKKPQRAAPELIAVDKRAVATLWACRCQVLEATDELLKSGELNPADIKVTKQIAAKARAYTFQQFATAFRTDRARYEDMGEDVIELRLRAQRALKSVRATQAARAAQR